MKNNKNKKGFTLLEIILSIAIFSIMFVAFLSLFSTSFVQVMNTGEIGESVYSAQSQAEVVEASDFSEDDKDTLEINFGGTDIEVEGYFSTITDDDVELRVFIPDEE